MVGWMVPHYLAAIINFKQCKVRYHELTTLVLFWFLLQVRPSQPETPVRSDTAIYEPLDLERIRLGRFVILEDGEWLCRLKWVKGVVGIA